MGLFNPETYTKGGLFDDFDGRIVKAAIVRFDFAGTAAKPVVALQLTFDDGEHDHFTQEYKLGESDDWAPSPDGKKVIPTGKKAALNEKCAGARLFVAMVNAGVPVDLIEAASDDCTALVSLYAHWRRTVYKNTGKGKDGKEMKDSEILVPTVIHNLPGEAEAEADAEIATKATEAITEILRANKEVKKADLLALMFAAYPEDAQAMSKFVVDDAFLAAGPWKYKGGILKA